MFGVGDNYATLTHHACHDDWHPICDTQYYIQPSFHKGPKLSDRYMNICQRVILIKKALFKSRECYNTFSIVIKCNIFIHQGQTCGEGADLLPPLCRNKSWMVCKYLLVRHIYYTTNIRVANLLLPPAMKQISLHSPISHLWYIYGPSCFHLSLYLYNHLAFNKSRGHKTHVSSHYWNLHITTRVLAAFGLLNPSGDFLLRSLWPQNNICAVGTQPDP